MEREYLRRPEQPSSAQRKKEIEERIRRLREEKRRSRSAIRKKKRGREPGGFKAPLVLALLLAALYLIASAVVATVKAASFNGDTALYEQEVSPKNLDELQSYIQSSSGAVRPAPPEISAKAAALYDPETGQFLYEKDADRQLPNASTTKMMTAILALENSSLSEKVTISRRASTTPEQSIWLQEGEFLTVEQLLYALMLRSANDAAVALAEHVSGSVEAFAELMNRRAAEIGARNTNFVTPNGLDAPGHRTTARDLAYIGAYCMDNEDFRKIVVTDSYALPPSPANQWSRVCENRNKLLKIYPYANGIKTGYTEPAGKCLVGSAEKGGRRLISVILNGGDDYFEESRDLLEYGFEDFTRVVYALEGEEVFRLKVGHMPQREATAVASSDLKLTVRTDRVEEALGGVLRFRRWSDYPLEKGQIGELIVNVNGYTARVGLVACEALPSPESLDRLWSFLAAIFTFGTLSLFEKVGWHER